DFPCGVGRQLLEGMLLAPAAAERAFAGAGAPARAVFERVDALGEGGSDFAALPGLHWGGLNPAAERGALGEGGSDFAALHGLYWVVLNLAAERTLILSVDDIHWADRPSLRFLA